MAFDFNNNNKSGQSFGSSGNPFGSSANNSSNPFGSSSNSSRGSAGFSSGNSGKGGFRGGKSSNGFQFPGGKGNTNNPGFSNLPAKRGSGKQDLNVPERREPREWGSRRRGGGSGVPWKLIIWFILILTAAVLIVTNWDLIVYVVYKLITYLIILIVLITILRLLFRRRKR